jgi:hypothetical protein
MITSHTVIAHRGRILLLLCLLPVFAAAQQPLLKNGFAKMPPFSLSAVSIPGLPVVVERPVLTVIDDGDEEDEDPLEPPGGIENGDYFVEGLPVGEGMYLMIFFVIFYGICCLNCDFNMIKFRQKIKNQ